MSTAESPNKKPRLAVVIGSGGIKCVAALGMLKVLKREGIPIDMAVGCSGGSLYAAVMALGHSYDESETLTASLWQGTFKRLYFRSVLRALLPRVFGFSERFGLVDDRRLNNALEITYGQSTFADTTIPLTLVACDFRTGTRVELTQGLIRDAVRSSVAIPVLLRPWLLEGRLLIDGGAVDPLPVSVAIREGSDIILAMGFETPYETNFSSLSDIVNQSINILTNNLLESTYAFYSMAHHAEVIPILPTFERSIGLSDTHLIPYLIEQGEKATEAQVPYLKRLLAASAV